MILSLELLVSTKQCLFCCFHNTVLWVRDGHISRDAPCKLWNYVHSKLFWHRNIHLNSLSRRLDQFTEFQYKRLFKKFLTPVGKSIFNGCKIGTTKNFLQKLKPFGMVLEIEQSWEEAGECVGCWALSTSSGTHSGGQDKHQVRATSTSLSIPQAWLAAPFAVITPYLLKIPTSSSKCAPHSTPLVGNVAVPGWPGLCSGQKWLITVQKQFCSWSHVYIPVLRQ